MGLTTAQMQTASNFGGFTFTTTPGAAGNNWVIVNADGTLQTNASTTAGATFPMLASEYSTTINNAHQLQLMAMNLAGNYTLGSNIDASNTAITTATALKDVWSTTGGFVPVGNGPLYGTTNFSGTFDGQGHTINGLVINLPSANYVGLFGYTSLTSAIRNVGLAGGSVSGTTGVGGLVGSNNGTISNSYATCKVSGGNSYVGGLVGFNNGTISNSYATGTVSGFSYVGGLVGSNNTGAMISNSYAAGSVSGTATVGGLAGYNYNATISNSFYDTTTSGQSKGIGGKPDVAGTVWGMSTADMKLQANFTGATVANGNHNPTWDFTTKPVWGIDSAVNNGYPYLCSVTAACFTQIYLDLITGGTSVYGSKPNFTYAYYTSATYGSGTLITDAGESGTIVWSSGAPTSSSNVGTYSVAYSGGINLGNSAYKLAAGNAVSWLVTPAPLTVSGTTVANKTYDGGLTAGLSGGTLLGMVNGDGSNLTLTQAGTFASKNAGSGIAVTAADTLSGTAAGNYTLTQPTGLSANITALAVTLTAPSVSKTYDGGLGYTATTGNLSALAGSLVGGDTITAATIAYADKNAGSESKTVSLNAATINDGNGGNNYSVTLAGNSTSTITPLAIAVAATGVSKVYDAGVNATATLFSESVISGDTVSFASASATFADKNVANAKTVSVTGISASGTDAGNYTLNNTSATTTANITPLAITVAASGVNKVYDAGVNDAATLSSTGVLSGDTVAFASTSATFADKNAALGKTVSVAGISASGTDAGNYTLNNSTASTSADITPKALSVSGLGASDKVYDGTTAATVNTAQASYTGLIDGDVVSTTSVTGAFADKNVGNAKAVSLTANFSGADAGNYSVSAPADLTASITPKAVSVSGLSASDKVYDGSTAATVNTAAASLNGLVSGDVLNVKASGTFSDKNAATGKTVTLASSYAGADAGNYSITDQTSSTASISQATLTYTATPTSLVAGQTPSGLSGSVNGFVSGDTQANASSGTLGWTSPVTTSSPAGQYAINGGGLSASNYVFVQAGGNASALSLKPGTPPAAVLNATTQLALNVLSPQVGNRPDMLSLSPTITVTQGSSREKGDNTNADANSSTPPSVNVAMNIGSNGPALQIISGGMRLPTNLVNVNE